MDWILPGLLVISIIVILVLLLQRQHEPASPLRAATAKKPVSAVPVPPNDDESTQVRVVGHRLVRLAGGLKVGPDIPIVNVMTIGRDKTCGLSLNDPEMSHTHAQIQVERGRAYIMDQNSTNGTSVNDEQLASAEPRLLEDGDRIKLGATTLMYKSQS